MSRPLPVEIPEVFIKRLSVVGTKRFIRVSPQNKNPIDQEWQKTENLRTHNDVVLKAHMRAGGNYGVVGGTGLIIIDADTPELDKILEEKLPPTFKVRSPGSRLPHRYYQTDLNKPLRLRNNAGANIGDIQGPGKQVLGPGSIHPNGKPYEIVDDRELAFVGKAALKEALSEWLVPEKEIQEIETAANKESAQFPDLTIARVIEKYGIQLDHKQGDEFYGVHPQHGSGTGRNFWINTTKSVWHCFRCSSGGGPLSLIAVIEGIIPCEEATKGALTGDKFVKVLRAAVDNLLLDESQLKKTTPSNDEDYDEFCDKGKFVPKLLSEDIQKKHLMVTPGLKTDIYRYRVDEGVWTPDGEKIIRETAARLLGSKEKKARIDEVVSCIKNSTYIDRNRLGKNDTRIVVKNGVLNLETAKLEPFDPNLYAINALPVKYDLDKKCPKILKFLDEVAPQDIETLQEWVGYHLLKAYPYHKWVMLVGDGANGKSTFLNLLGEFLGEDNFTTLSLYLITSRIFAIAELYGKLSNIAPDISADELKRTGTLKALTGADRIRAEKKYQESFYFYNYAKLSFSANQAPISPDQSRAFFRRCMLIGFPNKFEGEECDPAMLKKLTAEDEMSGFLNWALIGLNRLVTNGKFTKSPTTEELQLEYEALSDPVTAFINNCIGVYPDSIETKDAIYAAYFQFCRGRGFSPVMSNILTKELKPRLPGLKSTTRTITQNGDKKRKGSWEGLRLLCDECGKCERPDFAPSIKIKKLSSETLGGMLCEECNQPITDGSKIEWRDGRRVCRQCQQILIEKYKEKMKNG